LANGTGVLPEDPPPPHAVTVSNSATVTPRIVSITSPPAGAFVARIAVFAEGADARRVARFLRRLDSTSAAG
jgi:hypothetical protein